MSRVLLIIALAASAIVPATASATSPQVQKYRITKPLITAFNSGFGGHCSGPGTWVVCRGEVVIVALTRPSLCIVEVRMTTATGTNAQIIRRLDRSPLKVKRANVC